MKDSGKSIPVTNDSQAADPIARLKAAVRDVWDDLSPAERTVCGFLANCPPERLLFSSAQELGAASGTSNASVVRAVRRLGYAGLPGLKREVAAGFSSAVAPEVRLHQRIADAGGDLARIRARVYGEAAERVEQGARCADDPAFAEAVKLLAETGTADGEVMTYGVAASELAARHLALKLNRIGRRARFVGATGFALADELLPLRRGDAVVIFAPGRLLQETIVILDRARTVGAARIVVSDELLDRLSNEADVVLSAPHTPTGVTAEALTAIVLSDALLLALAALDEPRAVDSSHQLTTLRQDLLVRDRR